MKRQESVSNYNKINSPIPNKKRIAVIVNPVIAATIQRQQQPIQSLVIKKQWVQDKVNNQNRMVELATLNHRQQKRPKLDQN